FNVPIENPQALIDKIDVLVNNPKLLRQMQENAYALYLQRHHPDVVAEKLARVFEAALSGPSN
ncbi:MAG: glycosyltransferase, partial [Dehalococcoidia bacterium]